MTFEQFIRENVQRKIMKKGEEDEESQVLFYKYLVEEKRLAEFIKIILKTSKENVEKNIEKLAAFLVAKPALKSLDIKSYFDSICLQLRDLLMYGPDPTTCRASAFVAIAFLKRKPLLARKLILSPLLNCLRCMYDASITIDIMASGDSYDLDGNKVLVDESILQGSLRALTFLFALEPIPLLIDELNSVFLHLFVINTYYTKSKVLVNEELEELVMLLFSLHEKPAQLLRMSFESGIVYSAGGICATTFVGRIRGGRNGKVSITRTSCQEDEEERNTMIQPTDLISFIQKHDKELAGDFFVEIVDAHLRLKRNLADEQQEEEEDDDALVMKFATDVLVMYAALILEMLETFGETLLQKTLQILKFVKISLLDEDGESINLGLTLLTHILSGGGSMEDEEDEEDEEEPLHFNANDLHELGDIKIILSTLVENEDASIAGLAALARLKLSSVTSSASTSKDKADANAESHKIFRSAIKDLGDESIPIRAHGLSLLIGLVSSRDAVATTHIDAISTIFFDLLSDEDSFIYLNAVKACSALTEHYPSQSIAPLTERYKSSTLSVAYRTRIGESLLRTMQRLGEAISSPHHAVLLINAVLVVMRSPDQTLQSSALVLCSQIVRQGPRVLEKCIGQVSEYIIHVLMRPTEAHEVVKGTLVLLNEIVLAFGVDLEDAVGREVFGRIKWAVAEIAGGASRDLVCQGHAERIMDLFRKLLFCA